MKTQKALYAIRNKHTLEWVVLGNGHIACNTYGQASGWMQARSDNPEQSLEETGDYEIVQVLGSVV